MIQPLSAIVLAYILDLIFGDPVWLPHPVRGIGYFAHKLEISLREGRKNEPRSFCCEERLHSKKERGERIAGIIFAVVIIGVVYGVSYNIISAANNFNRYLGFALSAFLIYTSLAIKDLKVESMRVYQALKRRDMDLARKNLSLIVGRDTQTLNDKEIIRATVETVAENTVDGIISPFFYAFLGGAPLALAYKAANTLDSMVGYKNDKYKNFGWASARIDDCANFIPARLSVLILPLASLLAGKDGWNSLKLAVRDGRKSSSPNSGLPEAAIAGALKVQLGGLNFYNSVPILKPFIGDNCASLNVKHIKESIRIMHLASGLFLALALYLGWFI